MKYPKVFSSVMAGALALSLGLTACGGSSTSTTSSETKTEETVEQKKDETKTTEETTEESTEETSSNLDAAIALFKTWSAAYMGESEAGELYYYAESPDGGTGVMLIVDPDTDEYVSFVGSNESINDTTVKLTDDSTGNSITYEVVEATDNGVVLDLGDDGKVALANATMDEFVEAFTVINETCTPVA